jgi:hypothetical protein
MNNIINGGLGYKGEPGVSPTIDVSKTSGVTTLTITDVEGTKTATINDGEITRAMVVDNLTTTTTDVPLSANQGKVLKDSVDTKANANDVYTKTIIDSKLENINGTVLWVNPNLNSSFREQTIELNLDDYDEIEVLLLNDYVNLMSRKLYRFNNEGTSKLSYNQDAYVHGDWDSSLHLATINATVRKIEWVASGIKFYDAITYHLQSATDGSNTLGTTIGSYTDLRPLAIIGRNIGLYNNQN